MKLFTQLALVTAIATSGSAFAMQSMDDSALSATTGQDGITILVAPTKVIANNLTGAAGAAVLHGISIDTVDIFDNNGFGPAASSTLEQGAIRLTGVSVAGDAPIKIEIDSSANTAGAVSAGAVLNVKVTLPTVFQVHTGAVSVTGSTGAQGAHAVDVANTASVANDMVINLGGASLNIQLGHQPQGHLIQLNSVITGGLTINNVGLNQSSAAGVGTLGVGTIAVTDNAGGGNLTLDVGVDVRNTLALQAGGIPSATAGGLVVTLGAASKFDVYMTNVTLGDAASTLGDVKMTGVDLGGAKLIISGH